MSPPRLSMLLLCCAWGATCLPPHNAQAQAMPEHGARAPTPAAPHETISAADQRPRLPADVTTHHTLVLPGRTLHFTATAGSVQLTNAQGAAEAQIGFIAYQLDGVDAHTRPITVALNGGPGSGSAWLNLGVLGPWRLPMNADAAAPSAPPVVQDNADTWLDFTDLVFIDAASTGFSRLLINTDETRKKYYSVSGDIDSIAEVVRRWLVANRRLTSPKFIVGESYGGFRGPRLVRALAEDQGIGISGLVLISPKLDYGGRSAAFDPLSWVDVLPSEVAAARARKGPVTRADMADVEAYASGEYLTDLLHGEADPAGVERRIAKLSELTGLDPALLRRRHARVPNSEFIRMRDPGQIASYYDVTVSKPDPNPFAVDSWPPDSMTDALGAPFTSAMLDVYATRLNWLPEATYRLANTAVNRAWVFGNSMTRPESVSSLRTALALDPGLNVLIAHGLFDIITPYFETQLILNQLPLSAGANRVTLAVYPGGHMFYSRDDSRSALRQAVQSLYAPR